MRVRSGWAFGRRGVVVVGVAALMGLASGGCGDDGGGGGGDTSVTADTLAPADTGATTDTETGADTLADTGTGGDTAVADTTATDTLVADTAKDPNDPCGYQFSENTSYMLHLALASVAAQDGADGKPVDHCCFDQTGDQVADNKLGEIVALIQDLPQITNTVNAVIASNIADGTFTVLFEMAHLDSFTADNDVTIYGFYGTDTDADTANNAAGTGSFSANLSSFAAGTATPRIAFPDVIVTNGNFFAGPDVFHLDIPLAGGLELVADIQNARLEGTVAAGPAGGVAVDGPTVNPDGGTFGAKLGGYIAQDDLFGAFNSFVANRCGCLSVAGGGPVLVKNEAAESWGCASSIDKSGCSQNDTAENQCRTLADVCGIALALVAPDVDTDNSGKPDAFSLGFWVKTTGATIVGVDPATCGN
ncbi:MAG: hypothetical protein KC635_06065 [Myxococcales bacterium]|nr:hypothetical protein [Myxococcales bacterium]